MTKISRRCFVEVEGSQLSLPCRIERREPNEPGDDSVCIYLSGPGDQLHVFYATSIDDVADIYCPGTFNDWWLAIQAGV